MKNETNHQYLYLVALLSIRYGFVPESEQSHDKKCTAQQAVDILSYIPYPFDLGIEKERSQASEELRQIIAAVATVPELQELHGDFIDTDGDFHGVTNPYKAAQVYIDWKRYVLKAKVEAFATPSGECVGLTGAGYKNDGVALVINSTRSYGDYGVEFKNWVMLENGAVLLWETGSMQMEAGQELLGIKCRVKDFVHDSWLDIPVTRITHLKFDV